MKIKINIWNYERDRWDEEDATVVRVTKKQIIVSLNGKEMRFFRDSGLLQGIACNQTENIPNHTAPFIDAEQLSHTKNLVRTDKPLYQRL